MANFKKGDRVEISSYPNEEEVYFSMLEAVVGDNSVIIYMPIVQWYFVKLSPKREYFLSFVSSVDFSLLRYKSAIVNYSKKDGFYFILFNLLGKGEKIERRSHFRFAYQAPFVFYKIGETEEIAIDLNIYYDGLLLDISAGGIRFASNEEIEKEGRISCLITLGDDQLIADSIIVAKKETEDSTYLFEYRAKFESDPVNQDKITQFIFDEQRKRNKRVSMSE